MTEPPLFRIERLDSQNRSHFSCGIPELDQYLKSFARQDATKRTSACYVLTDGDQILGYYTLSSAMVKLAGLPEATAKRLPRYPDVPAIRIGRLAVSSQHQSKGLGEQLLMDALRRSLKNSDEIGAAVIIVDAKNERSKAFYMKYGFISFEERPFQLFIHLETVEKLQL